MDPDWYYAHHNEPRGPITGSALLALEHSGVVQPGTLVWKAGMPSWQPWSSVAAEVRAATAAGAAVGRGAAPATASAPAAAPSSVESAVCAYSGQTRPISLMVKYGDRWVALEYKEAFLQSLREGVPVARMAGVGELQYVGFWWRVLALLVDVLVLIVPNALVALPYYYLAIRKALSGGLAPSLDPLHEFKTMDATMAAAYVLMMLGNMLIPLVYNTLMVGRFGATVGKMVIGARVAKPSGAPLTYLQALGRGGAKLLNMLVWAVPGTIALLVGSLISFGSGVQTGGPEEVPVAMLVGLLVMMLWSVVGGFGYYMAGWTRKKQALHDLIARTVVVRKTPA
jgi:uncharacterized RDD family membrane protein YckC